MIDGRSGLEEAFEAAMTDARRYLQKGDPRRA